MTGVQTCALPISHVVEPTLLISPQKITLAPGACHQFKAEHMPSGTIAAVKWSMDKAGSVSENGLVRAPERFGVYKLTATAIDSDVCFTAEVTVGP